MQSNRKRIVVAIIATAVVGAGLVIRANRRSGVVSATTGPAVIDTSDQQSDEMTMAGVLEMARNARKHMSENLDDYTARFVKQEPNKDGVLGEESEFFMKVQTRLRGDGDNAPMRVYLKVNSPESIKGREVAWAEDMNEGKLAVHETYFPLNLKTIWLDPNGYLAMQDQRYPISEIGLVRLVEKLVERGEVDVDDPDITVTMTKQHSVGDTPAELIQVHRAKPNGTEDDFSLAEIAIDPDRQLILSYRSFGWPTEENGKAPLLESYTYFDVKTNVGLTEKDFDPSNPEYGFP